MHLEYEVDSEINPTVYCCVLWRFVTSLHILFLLYQNLCTVLLLLYLPHAFFSLQLVKLYLPADGHLDGNVLEPLQHHQLFMICMCCYVFPLYFTYLLHKFAVFSDMTLQRGKLQNVLTAHGAMNMYGK